MKLIILAAGYATRLYPLTLNQPKPLLPVAGKPMLEHVLDNIANIRHIDHAYIVTNAKSRTKPGCTFSHTVNASAAMASSTMMPAALTAKRW